MQNSINSDRLFGIEGFERRELKEVAVDDVGNRPRQYPFFEKLVKYFVKTLPVSGAVVVVGICDSIIAIKHLKVAICMQVSNQLGLEIQTDRFIELLIEHNPHHLEVLTIYRCHVLIETVGNVVGLPHIDTISSTERVHDGPVVVPLVSL